MYRRRCLIGQKAGITIKLQRDGFVVSGASVVVGGITCLTDTSGLAVFDALGDVTVSIAKTNSFKAFSQSYTVSAGDIITVNLEALYILKITTLTGSTIQLTGSINTSKTTNLSTTTFVDIPKGDVRYTVSKGGYESETDVVTLSGNTTEEIVSVTLLKSASVGDFVYQDGTYSSTLNTGKVCVGICFYSMGNDRRMVNTKTVTINHPDFPDLCYYGPHELVPNVVTTTSKTTAEQDMKGEENTKATLAIKTTLYPQATVLSDYPLVNYCNNYYEPGFERGRWWLFSLGEIKEIYNNITLINNRITQIGGDVLDTGMLLYITSTQYDASKIWVYSTYSGIKHFGSIKENTRTRIRPVTFF